MLFNPVDLTWLTFLIIYVFLIGGLFLLAKEPFRFILTMKVYGLMVLFRIAAMYLLPLEPPEKMIPLSDPIVEIFGTGRLLTKDLFFSGHTATLFILYLTAEKKFRLYFLFGTIAVAVCVIMQHVHYTIDVAAAFVFTFAAYSLFKKTQKI